MRAFVTGGGGFIDRHVVQRLLGTGVEVRAIARSDTSAGEITLAELVRRVAAIAWQKPPRLSTPTWALRAASPIARRFGRDLGELVRASAGVTYWPTDAKARADLGYVPRDLEAGLPSVFGSP